MDIEGNGLAVIRYVCSGLYPLLTSCRPQRGQWIPRRMFRGLGVEKLRLVELRGFEPLTPCMQSRCSPTELQPHCIGARR